MRVFIILPRLDGGGMERMRLHLVEEFRRLGIELTLVVGRLSGELVCRIPSGVPVVEVARPGTPWFFLGLLQAVWRHRPTHILSGADDINCLVLLAKRLRLLRARVVVSNHNTLSCQIAAKTGLARLKLKSIRTAMRWLYPIADCIVAVSEGVADDLSKELKIDKKGIRVIYNPVIDSSFASRLAAPLPDTWPSSNDPIILYVGRLTKEKRPDLLLNAFDKVQRRTKALLVLAGAGPCRPWIESQIAHRGWQDAVVMLGFVINPLPLMRSATVLVLPSDYEGLPNVLIEALGCGTQVVATDCQSGPREILANGTFGRLVARNNSDAVAQAILDCIENRFLVSANALVERARAFSSGRAAKEYLDALRGSSDQCRAREDSCIGIQD